MPALTPLPVAPVPWSRKTGSHRCGSCLWHSLLVLLMSPSASTLLGAQRMQEPRTYTALASRLPPKQAAVVCQDLAPGRAHKADAATMTVSRGDTEARELEQSAPVCGGLVAERGSPPICL